MTKKTPEKVNIVLYGACFALCFLRSCSPKRRSMSAVPKWSENSLSISFMPSDWCVQAWVICRFPRCDVSVKEKMREK